MAQGKSRNNKRSSSTSYSSTITTVIFLTLCVLGVWMMTSDSISPPKATRRTATSSSSSTSASAGETQVVKSNGNTLSFEGDVTDFPEDALKSDGSDGGEKEGKQNDKEESPKESGDGGDRGGQNDQAADSVVSKESSLGEKQKESEAQLSEESPFTVSQQASVSDQTQQPNLDQNRGSKTGEEKIQEQNAIAEIANPIGETEQSTTIQEIPDSGSHANPEEPRHQTTQPGDNQSEKIAEITRRGMPKFDQKQQKNADDASPEEFQLSKHQFPDVTSNAALQTQASAEEKENQAAQPGKKVANSNSGGSLENTGIPRESKESKKSWATQAAQSKNEKNRRIDGKASSFGYTWQLCNVTAGPDYIPCLDNMAALRRVRSTRHFEHRERHCPEEGPTCLVPLPEGYKTPIQWPASRDKIWYHNVPHTLLAEVKGHQNWVKVTGEFLTFPGGGTQFIHGALHYIDFLQQSVPKISWGKHSRVILDVGCGVASFGGYLFERDVLAMSFAPKDEHEAQVQFALERGIPAISAVMGSQRLPFPSNVFDVVHCARCRVPWHAEGGRLLLELNRLLRPGGYFVWSATPVYQKLQEDVEIWKAMSSLTASMCWDIVTIQRDKLNSIGAAIYQKPISNDCYDRRKHKSPPMCKEDDDPNAAWYVPLQTCMHKVPVDKAQRGSRWPESWPRRLRTPPYWLNSSQMGIYGKPSSEDFATDYEHWKKIVNKTYTDVVGINWSNVRNVMDMRSVYGGFAAALRDLKLWVLNVVNTDSPDTLSIIFERGLFGIYHDWCESFSTYPRTYDLLHADHLFSKLKQRCKLAGVMAEVDRMVRPGGKLIVLDESGAIGEVENLLKSLHWEVHLTFSKNQEGLLSAQKGDWRPDTYADSS